MKIENFLIEKLQEQKIDYFSFSVLKKNTPIISYCNNKEWLDYYNEEYSIYKEPPVQKYITSSAMKLLLWDLSALSSETRKYLHSRNDVVGVGSNATIICRRGEFLTAVTFGTKYDKNLLLRFLNENVECLSIIKRELL